MLSQNTKAPDFTLRDQKGISHTLSHYRGFWVLVYFYPKDNTPGCTKEACTIQENYAEFEKNNIQVFGISTDSVKSHKKFADKFSLSLRLLSDEKKEVSRTYKAYGKKKFMGREYLGIKRISYLINPEGIIVKTYPNVKPAGHALEILHDRKSLRNSPS